VAFADQGDLPRTPCGTLPGSSAIEHNTFAFFTLSNKKSVIDMLGVIGARR
jgi:hypothetical protein